MSKTKPISFPESALDFLKKLSKNNDKEWFEAHRDDYNAMLLEPAQDFVKELGAKLQKIRPGIQAVPKIDKSIFRLHRDVRFSKDKSPYKTNLGILFWEGSRKKMENPGLYVHLEPGKFMAGLGMHMFTKDQLVTYRDTIADTKNHKDFLAAINKVTKKGYEIYGKNYKQVPRGYDKDMPNAEWLLYNGIFGWHETGDVKAIIDNGVIKHCVKLFKDMLPIHEWLLSVMEPGK